MRAGRFNLKRAANYYELIRTLCDWDIETVRITIPEGLRAYEIARLLEKRLGVSAAGFMQKAMDPNFTHELGIAASTLEGYLYPDTYDLLEGDSPEYVIRRLVGRLGSSQRFVRAISDGPVIPASDHILASSSKANASEV
jgi:UPF0755 protein